MSVLLLIWIPPVCGFILLFAAGVVDFIWNCDEHRLRKLY
jgi:hypothetical protein